MNVSLCNLTPQIGLVKKKTRERKNECECDTPIFEIRFPTQPLLNLPFSIWSKNLPQKRRPKDRRMLFAQQRDSTSPVYSKEYTSGETDPKFSYERHASNKKSRPKARFAPRVDLATWKPRAQRSSAQAAPVACTAFVEKKKNRTL